MLDLIDVELGKASPMITEHYESKTLQDPKCAFSRPSLPLVLPLLSSAVWDQSPCAGSGPK